ncbi:hypothetical protein [Streptomyces sp. NPDC018031]|uniref:hypothetical protein n=1 Tax=Streptomyces sp. NPDC018031 TaxID=3365033 RepID=UPI00379AAB34
MGPYLFTLAGTAGTSLVTLLVGEGWQQTRDGVVTIWRRFRPQAAEEVERELDASRTTALGAADRPDPSGRVGRFAALLSEHPEAADDLRDLVEGWRRTPDRQRIDGGVHLEARPEDNA